MRLLWERLKLLVDRLFAPPLLALIRLLEELAPDRDSTMLARTISGMRFEIRGMIGDEARIIVEHVTRLRDGDAPDWPQGGGYRIGIAGEPNVHLELSVSSDIGDHNHAGCLATAMHVINAIPLVVEADPGVLTYLDLPVYGARHLMR